MPNLNEFIYLITQHLFIVTISVVLACVVAIPLAILVYKKNFHVNTVVNVVSLFQSFPALGLFAIFVPLIGIGLKTVVLALFLYALLPIFINTIQGFKSINPDYYTIINSINISKRDVLRKVEMPLVLPHIISGIRLTVIYTISTATVGALVGAGGLGDLIYLGLQQASLKITFMGIIPLLIITIIANYVLNKIQLKYTTPDFKQNETSKSKKTNVIKYLIFSLLVIIIGFFGYIQINKDDITIGSKSFTEQFILSAMLEQLIESETDLKVGVKQIGETPLLHSALLNKDIDMYVEYSSNSFQAILNQTYAGQTSEEINNYNKEQYNEKFGLDWLYLFGFENTNAIICTEYCTENNISSLNDLKNYTDFTFAAPVYFYERADGFDLLADNYQINIDSSQQKSLDPNIIYSSVSSNQIDLGLAFTTDGNLKVDDYTVLQDTNNVFPKYDAGLIISNETKLKYPQLVEKISLLANSISNEEMKELNYLVDIKGEKSEDVARQFLIDNGYISN